MFFLLSSLSLLKAQQTDTIPRKAAVSDTVQNATRDTLKRSTATGLNSEVKYSAEDSIRFDRQNNVVYLYGSSRIAYEDFELVADYIRLDQKNNTLFAKGLNDPKTKRFKGRPIFTQSGQQPVTTDSLVFNFKNKKGKTYGTFSDVEGGYIHAGESKKNEYDEISFKNSIYSTCNLPHPHFGIHIAQGIVTEKNIVARSAYLVIEDIPFPAWIPFGFFPKVNKRTSGILFPTFGEEQQRGFFLRDFGYYIGLNDYWDAELRGAVFSKGSYEGSLLGRYTKNYKYSGNLNFRYAYSKFGIEGIPGNRSKDFNLQWSHSQRPEANPGTTFSASVNFGTGSYFTNTGAGGTYNVDQLTRNQMNSSIAYGRTFADGRVNFSSSLRHSQDLTTGLVQLTLPDFNLGVSTFNPFDSKDRVGEQKWYQRISVGYNLQGTNSINTIDSTLFTRETLSKLTTGFQHNIPVNLSLNVLKFFQFSTGVNYSERWYLQTIRKNFQRSPTSNRDSLVTDTVPGFSRAAEYSLSGGLSTKVYGIKTFRKGNLQAIRHVMTPSISFNYRPDFGSENFGYYRDVLDRNGNPVISDGMRQRYSIYENSVYGGPGQGRSAAIGFSLDNNLEAKVKSKSDTATTEQFEKIPILQGFSFSGSYNFVADSLKLSQISFNGRSALFKQKLGINFGGTFDPYLTDAQGRTINKYAITEGKLARLTNLRASLDFSFNSSAVNERNKNIQNQETRNITPQQREDLERISRDPNAFVDFNVPWNIVASYSFNYSKIGLNKNISNTLNFSGDFSVTPKWKVQYNSGYDFNLNTVTVTQFSIYRDLHCWDLNFNWTPFGPWKSYSVDLRVKASILQDLKLSKRRSHTDNFIR